MKTYKVLNHPSKELKAVKTGFAWLAIPFFPWWFLSRRLWMIFLTYILIVLILASIDYELYGELGFFNFSTANDLQIFIFIAALLLKKSLRISRFTSRTLRKYPYLFRRVVYLLLRGI